MIVPMRFFILCLCGNVLVSAIVSFRTDEHMSGKLHANSPTVLKQQQQQPSSSIALKEEPLWVPWWVPQVSTHFTFFRAVMAGFFTCFIFATAAFLAGYTPSKLGHKDVLQGIRLWIKTPSVPEPTAPAPRAIPQTPNVDDLDSELLKRACYAEAIARERVAAMLDAKEAAKSRNKKQPVPKEDLVSSDDEDVEDPDPPLRPGAEAPFTMLFGAQCAEGAKFEDHTPFELLMADEPRSAVDTIQAPMEACLLKTTISTKKFQHSILKKAKMESENKGLPSSS